MSAIEDILWPGFKAVEPKVLLGGILARKPGYHNSRDHLPADDYSVAQFAVDREGPANEGSAIDLTFPDAQSGNYTTISKYSKRLYAARTDDPRTVYMREFFGNTDSDVSVEGWDYSKNKASSSDSSHLWHIHISIHRKYINSTGAMKAILSVLKGETVEEWKAQNARDVVFQYFDGKLPVLKKGDSDPIDPSGTYYINRAQRALQVTADGDYGPITATAVKNLGIAGKDGNTIDNDVWERLYATWGMTVTSSKVVDGGSKRDVTFQYFTNAKLPILKKGDSDEAGGIDGTGTTYIKRAQRQLQVDDDGEYGPATAAAVKALNMEGYTGNTIDLAVWQRLNALWGAKQTKKVTVDPSR